MQLSDKNKLNVYDHYDLIEYLENKYLDYLYNKYNLDNNCTLEFKNKNYNYILHKSTKNNKYQISYFYKNNAISDKEVNSIKEGLKCLMFNKLLEVIR